MKLASEVDGKRQPGQSITLTVQSEMAQRKMTSEKISLLPGNLGTHFICTAIRRQYHIERDYQSISDIFIFLPVKTSVAVSASTQLGIDRSRLPPGAIDDIVNAFSSYDFDKNGTVLQFLAVELTAYNSKHSPGLDGSEFDLFLETTYEWLSREILDTSDRWLHRIFEEDAGGSVPDLFKEGESFRDRGYQLRFVSDTYLNEMPAPTGAKNIIQIGNGIIGDKQAEEQIASERAREIVRGKECKYVDEELKIRITSFSPWDQSEWRWEWMRYGNTHGCSFDMWGPHLYTRTHRYVVYAIVLWAQPLEALKKIFEDSARDAAELATAIAIVQDNFQQAVDIFKAEFWRLVKERARQTYACLAPDLIYEEESGEWRPAGWPDP